MATSAARIVKTTLVVQGESNSFCLYLDKELIFEYDVIIEDKRCM